MTPGGNASVQLHGQEGENFFICRRGSGKFKCTDKFVNPEIICDLKGIGY